MALLLYLVVTLALLFVWARFVQPLTRAAALVLIVLPLLFTGRALLTDRVYAPIDLPFSYEPLASVARVVPHDIALSDLHCQIIPWQKAVRSALAQGEWPLWNPHILSGDILAAAAQPAVYDPFNALALLLPLSLALTFGASLTFFLAGFFTYAFARASGRGEIASLTAAAAYMFCGMMAFFVAWPLGRAWAFLPFVLFAVRRIVHDRRAGALLCAFVLLIVAGHPESVLHVAAAGAAYGVFELLRVRSDSLRTIGLALGAGGVALLLTAIYLLPFFDAAPQTLEHHIRTELYAKADYDGLASPERRAHRIGRTFLPNYDGLPWRGETVPGWDPLSARAGSIVLALAVAALFLAWRRGETWFWFGVAVVSLSATFGTAPFAHLLHALPLFDIAINERLAFAAVMAMAMLAAIAIDSLDRRAGLAVLGVAIVLGVATFTTKQPINDITLAELVPLAIVALLLLRLPMRITAPAILALVLVQRAIVDGSIYPALPRAMFYPRVPVLESIPKDGLSRIAGIGATLVPNGAAMYGLEDVRGYEAMTFKRLADTYPLWSTFQRAWFNRVDDPSRPFLSFLNVRYILDGTRVTENKAALPRAFIPRNVRYERTGEPILEAMKHATDFSDAAWIEVPANEPHDAANGPGTVTIRREGLGYELAVDVRYPTWVVVSETAWRGWRAYIDGRRVQTYFANHAFLGIIVPPGQHRVRLVYLPEAFTRGRNITVATLVLLTCAIVWRAWRRSSSTSRPR